MTLITAFAPIWLLAAAGYAARRFGILGERVTSVLGWLVFHVAVPAALFVTLAKTPLSGFGGRPLVAFAASTVLVLAAGWYLSARLFSRKPGERAIWGMAAGYVNSANLGIPIALLILHSVAFLVQVVLLQVLIVSPVILTILDRQADAAGRIRVRRILSLPVRNPVILASALGIIASETGWRPPPVLSYPLGWLAWTAVPAALITLGASLYQEGAAVPVARAELSLITVLKLIAQPAIAWSVGALVLHLARPQLLAVTVCAALPTAQNVFIYARQYGVGEALASRAVLITTTLSLATIAGIAALLGS
jgi:malonate transporter and related proteins